MLCLYSEAEEKSIVLKINDDNSIESYMTIKRRVVNFAAQENRLILDNFVY